MVSYYIDGKNKTFLIKNTREQCKKAKMKMGLNVAPALGQTV
jgi:hypothetical protein